MGGGAAVAGRPDGRLQPAVLAAGAGGRRVIAARRRRRSSTASTPGRSRARTGSSAEEGGGDRRGGLPLRRPPATSRTRRRRACNPSLRAPACRSLRDTLTVSLGFANGSVATIIYTALGDTAASQGARRGLLRGRRHGHRRLQGARHLVARRSAPPCRTAPTRATRRDERRSSTSRRAALAAS